MSQEYIGTKQVTAWPEMKEMLEGFGVEYADGYKSWSPKQVFEEAYLPIGQVKELPAFHQRLIGERAQLADRNEKLGSYLASDKAQELGSKQRELLTKQHAKQEELLAVLQARLDDL